MPPPPLHSASILGHFQTPPHGATGVLWILSEACCTPPRSVTMFDGVGVTRHPATGSRRGAAPQNITALSHEPGAIDDHGAFRIGGHGGKARTVTPVEDEPMPRESEVLPVSCTQHSKVSGNISEGLIGRDLRESLSGHWPCGFCPPLSSVRTSPIQPRSRGMPWISQEYRSLVDQGVFVSRLLENDSNYGWTPPLPREPTVKPSHRSISDGCRTASDPCRRPRQERHGVCSEGVRPSGVRGSEPFSPERCPPERLVECSPEVWRRVRSPLPAAVPMDTYLSPG